MTRQPQITPKIRAYCIDWVVELHRLLSQTYQTSIQADTLFSCICLFDRFLSNKIVSKEKIYLVILGCFFVSSKFEETFYPSADQLLKFAPQLGNREDLLKVERIILNELKYSLGAPTALTFLKRFAKAAHADATIGMVSRFITEYSLSSYSLSTNYLPSHIAAASIALALRIVGRPPWSATLQYYTGFTYEQLMPCMQEMRELVQKAPTLKTQAIYKKYSQAKYLQASLITVAHI
jgi:G2/mitotic-specific cyclin 1/2